GGDDPHGPASWNSTSFWWATVGLTSPPGDTTPSDQGGKAQPKPNASQPPETGASVVAAPSESPLPETADPLPKRPRSLFQSFLLSADSEASPSELDGALFGAL